MRIVGFFNASYSQFDLKLFDLATLLSECALAKHSISNKCLPGNNHYQATNRHDLNMYLYRILAILGVQKEVSINGHKSALDHALRSVVSNKATSKVIAVVGEVLTLNRLVIDICTRYVEGVLEDQAVRAKLDDEDLQWEMICG